MTGPFPPHRLRNQGTRQWSSAAALDVRKVFQTEECVAPGVCHWEDVGTLLRSECVCLVPCGERQSPGFQGPPGWGGHDNSLCFVLKFLVVRLLSSHLFLRITLFGRRARPFESS